MIYSRALLATETKLRPWFQAVENYLEKEGLLEIDSSRVFNCDENGFSLCPKPGEVLVRRGLKTVYKIVHGDDKENLTALLTISASGVLAPPLTLYKYKRITYLEASRTPKGWSMGTSEND